MYSVNVPNLLMAGRNISVSHVAFGSTRVMGTCAVAGQAVGVAAALCAIKGIDAQQLYADKPLLKAYQQTLLRTDQTVRNIRNEDPNDLALRAKAKASHEVEGSKADHAINGLVRDMPGSWSNRWGGEMKEDGAWIELSWDKPQTISQVQITFDSGFHRELTLSEQSARKKKMVLAAQPETVKDYTIAYKKGMGKFETVAEVKGNYLRLRRHDFEPVTTKAIRIHVGATNGSKEARIYEIRCYR
jgi:hypothetical protein